MRDAGAAQLPFEGIHGPDKTCGIPAVVDGFDGIC